MGNIQFKIDSKMTPNLTPIMTPNSTAKLTPNSTPKKTPDSTPCFTTCHLQSRPNYLTHWATRALQLPNSLSHPSPRTIEIPSTTIYIYIYLIHFSVRVFNPLGVNFQPLLSSRLHYSHWQLQLWHVLLLLWLPLIHW